MKIPFLRPVVPPHVFCLLTDGVTYANVRRDPAGFAETRSFSYPAGSLGASASGTPLFTREALSEAVSAARRLSEGRLTRASVIFPDAWARMLSIDFDTLPDAEAEAREMVRWKLKKLLPGVTAELAVSFRDMPTGEGKRLLVAAAPADTISSIEKSFESLGVRVGLLSPSSLALFEGTAPLLSERAGGDYALLHRAAGSLSFLIARGNAPLFYRQRPADEEPEAHAQELRLSLSYYEEKLKGPGLAALFVHDEAGGNAADPLPPLPVAPVALSGPLFGADAEFDRSVATRPELLPGFAAVWGA
jgi:type IV pilus assembly protein PilM